MKFILLLGCFCLFGIATADKDSNKNRDDKVSVRFTKNPDGSMSVEFLDESYVLTIPAKMVPLTGAILDFVTTTLNKGQAGSADGEVRFAKKGDMTNVNVAGTRFKFPVDVDSYSGYLDGLAVIDAVLYLFATKIFPYV